MKKHEMRKLVLNRETLRQLAEPELQKAQGGLMNPSSPTCSTVPCTC